MITIAHNATEIYSGEETEGVQDNDLPPEKEERERQEAESGGGVNMTEEEEDTAEEGEMEDEGVPAVTDEDKNDCEGSVSYIPDIIAASLSMREYTISFQKTRQISSLQHVEEWQQELSSRGLKR